MTTSSSSMSPSELCARYMEAHDAVMASRRKFQKGMPNLEKLEERHTNEECLMVDELAEKDLGALGKTSKIIEDEKSIDRESEKYMAAMFGEYVSAEPMFVKLDNFSSLLH